jgi:hypothetical protein
MKIDYIVGDVLCPVRKPAAIAHVVNNIGHWGGGFTSYLDEKYPKVGKFYSILKDRGQLELGDIYVIRLEEEVILYNMVAQDNTYLKKRTKLDYLALSKCLHKVGQHILDFYPKYTLHMPRIGCGPGVGGKWTSVEGIVRTFLLKNTIYTYVYDTTQEERAKYLNSRLRSSDSE